MKLWTIQNKNILRDLFINHIYVANPTYSKIYCGKGKKAYDLIIDKIKAFPIWTLYKYNGDEISYDYMMNMGNQFKEILPFDEESVLLEIEKNNNEVLLTDFYKWVDILYYYQDAIGKEKKELSKYANNLDYCLNLGKGCTIQAIIKDIKINEILNIYDQK